MDDFEPLAAAGITEEELATCLAVLGRLQEAEEKQLLAPNAPCLRPLRQAIGKFQFPKKKEKKELEKERQRERRQRQVEADKRWKSNAALRASRLARLQSLAIPDGPALEGLESGESGTYSRPQACYICKLRFFDRHHFYSHLCPSCAQLNFEKRHQKKDLSRRICLVTGARVKIGYQVALKLLRMGAKVIITTRFPQDARRRYQAEADSEEWLNQLQVIGADFRFLAGVEEMCRMLCREEEYLDIIINNACQTIRRPAKYYAHLLEEAQPKLVDADVGDSAALSQLAVLSEDKDVYDMALPLGKRDVHGQQLDLRSSNSWLLKLGEVETPELAEVFCINSLAPFIINSALKPLLERSPNQDRYIVNVSAMEGKFYRYKQPTHPHTNMAKAALNMMTRTCAEDLAMSGIYMNSVDTGWINDENPLPTAQRIAESHDFQTPIDEIDAAARILDPILGVRSEVQRPQKRGAMAGGGDGQPFWGWFFKDYAPTEW